MRRTFAGLVTVAALALGVAPLGAHHSFTAEFDQNKTITLRGTLTKVEFTNPHGWLYLNVKGPDGKILNWAIETGTPMQLIRQGGDRKTLAVGTEIVVDGFRSKDGRLRANGRDLTLPDGRALFFGSAGTGAPGDTKDPPEK